MAIEAGTQLGLYEIADPLGAGGMGEVYRAKDTKLDRDVAIKVLPDLFASDPERLARFEREAKVLASLNHPNIAAIYGLEDINGRRFLVMELVEGETLANRLKTAGGQCDLPAIHGAGLGVSLCSARRGRESDARTVHRDALCSRRRRGDLRIAV